MTNLNLNMTVSENGNVMATIYKVTAVNNEKCNRENLGYYANLESAEKQLKFWTETMGYTNGRIDWEILMLN